MADADSRPELWVCHLGLVEYGAALALQERLAEARRADELPDVLLVLEHPPVYTRGRRTAPEELPMGVDWYRLQGIDVIDAHRGGGVTYHGPGQVVAYPIMRVDGVRRYIEAMEGAIVAALAGEGLDARVREEMIGVWVGERKIGSIGVHVARGVSTHGLAVNCENDLQPFEWIVPCGLDGVRMTSITAETRRPDTLRCFRRALAWRLAEAYGRRQRLVSAARIGVHPAGAPASLALAT